MRFVRRIFILVFLFSVLIAGIGCGGGSMTSQNNSSVQPAIIFAATPSTVTSGVATLLTWKATNAKSVSIEWAGHIPRGRFGQSYSHRHDGLHGCCNWTTGNVGLHRRSACNGSNGKTHAYFQRTAK